MPLKHTTETLMIFVLAVAIIVTGMLMQTFPDVPNGLIPWAIVFAVAVLYPVLLGRMFRKNRADYEFRLLHWVPAGMLLLWLILQGVAYLVPAVFTIIDWYTWGWSLPAVATGFLFTVLFVFKVIRRWTTRVALLAVAFIPFMIGSVANEYNDWNSQLAATLWQGSWWQLDTSLGTQVAQNTPDDEKNLAASMDPTEEQYRERLRAIERRRERIAARLEERGLEQDDIPSSSSVPVAAVSSESISSAPMLSSSSSLPTQLPSSGFGWSAIIMLMAAAYCAAVQRKTILRNA